MKKSNAKKKIEKIETAYNPLGFCLEEPWLVNRPKNKSQKAISEATIALVNVFKDLDSKLDVESDYDPFQLIDTLFAFIMHFEVNGAAPEVEEMLSDLRNIEAEIEAEFEAEEEALEAKEDCENQDLNKLN